MTVIEPFWYLMDLPNLLNETTPRPTREKVNEENILSAENQKV